MHDLADAAFTPPRLLRSAALQSYMASFRLRRQLNLRRYPQMQQASQDHVVDAGAGVRLGAHVSRHPQAWGHVVLLHGWEGSHDSIYLHSLASYLYAHGLSVARLNLRDHGGTHHLNAEPFHSARMAEVFGGVRAAAALLQASDFALIGFSLGGNFTLRVAMGAAEHGLNLRQAIAVNPVLDPLKTARALDQSRLYQAYFRSKWLRTIAARRAAWPDGPDYADLLQDVGFVEISRRFVTRYCGFASLDEYFNAYTLSRDRCAQISVPTLIVSARDDALVPVADTETLAGLPQLTLCLPEHGGHCGYVGNLRLESWLEPLLLQALGGSPPAGHRAA